MKISENLKIILCDTPVGNVFINGEVTEDGEVIIESDATAFSPKFINFNINYIIENDVEQFKKLNANNDWEHQIHIDTLKIRTIRIYPNFIRVGYVFDQDLDGNCWRMCAGQLSHFYLLEEKYYHKQLFNECYSSDACVYW